MLNYTRIKKIKNNLIVISLIFLFSCKEKKNRDIESSIFFKDNNNLGLFIDGKKEGIWRFRTKDTFEFKCYSNGIPDSLAIYFIANDNKLFPLGVKINGLKHGVWFNYNNKNDSIGTFSYNIKTTNNVLQVKTLVNGKKVVIGSVDNFNKRVGLHLTYGDTALLFSNTFINGIMTGVFIINPLENDSTYSCNCAKNGYLNGYSFKYYLDDKIANICEYKNGKIVNIETFFNKKGEVLKKIDYSRNIPNVIYSINLDTFLPPPPPPPPN